MRLLFQYIMCDGHCKSVSHQSLHLFCNGKCLVTVSSSQLFLFSGVSWAAGNTELIQSSASPHLIRKLLCCTKRRPTFSAKVNRPQCNLNLKIVNY